MAAVSRAGCNTSTVRVGVVDGVSDVPYVVALPVLGSGSCGTVPGRGRHGGRRVGARWPELVRRAWRGDAPIATSRSAATSVEFRAARGDRPVEGQWRVQRLDRPCGGMSPCHGGPGAGGRVDDLS